MGSRKNTLKFIWKHKKQQIAKTTVINKNKTGITIPVIKRSYTSVIIKMVWHCKWNRMESPGIHACIFNPTDKLVETNS